MSKEKESIIVTDSSGRKLDIKKATFTGGKLIVDGESVNLMELLEQYFEDSIFSISITTKADNKYSPDNEVDITTLQ